MIFMQEFTLWISNYHIYIDEFRRLLIVSATVYRRLTVTTDAVPINVQLLKEGVSMKANSSKIEQNNCIDQASSLILYDILASMHQVLPLSQFFFQFSVCKCTKDGIASNYIHICPAKCFKCADMSSLNSCSHRISEKSKNLIWKRTDMAWENDNLDKWYW